MHLTVAPGRKVQLTAPRSNTPKTIHFILEAEDRGVPRLTSYRRVIVTIDPDLQD